MKIHLAGERKTFLKTIGIATAQILSIERKKIVKEVSSIPAMSRTGQGY